MAETNIIKGQAMISGNSLIQDQILISVIKGVPKEAPGTVTLIENIWDDLLSEGGQWKCNSKETYFYWEVTMTDLSDPSHEVTVKVEAPKPTPELFEFDFSETPGDSKYAKYWKSKFLETEDSDAYGKNALFSKEVHIPGTTYTWRGQNGEETHEIPPRDDTRGDFGDLSGLYLNIY